MGQSLGVRDRERGGGGRGRRREKIRKGVRKGGLIVFLLL